MASTLMSLASGVNAGNSHSGNFHAIFNLLAVEHHFGDCNHGITSIFGSTDSRIAAFFIAGVLSVTLFRRLSHRRTYFFPSMPGLPQSGQGCQIRHPLQIRIGLQQFEGFGVRQFHALATGTLSVTSFTFGYFSAACRQANVSPQVVQRYR